LNESIKRIEEKIAYLEHHVTAQDKVMLELADELARVRLELKALRERSSGADIGEASGGDLPTDERPPHY
jgi:SlyX protein